MIILQLVILRAQYYLDEDKIMSNRMCKIIRTKKNHTFDLSLISTCKSKKSDND